MNIRNIISAMRRRALTLAGIVAVAAVALCTACKEDNPYTPNPEDDWFSPYTITMRVENNNGQNLLDRKVAGNILNDSVTVEMDGSVYQLDTIPSEKRLPEGFPKADGDYCSFYGLWVYTPVGTRNYIMQMGEFGGKTPISSKQFVIHWNDGSKNDTVSWSHEYKVTETTKSYNTKVQLNGKDATMPITFVRDKDI